MDTLTAGSPAMVGLRRGWEEDRLKPTESGFARCAKRPGRFSRGDPFFPTRLLTDGGFKNNMALCPPTFSLSLLFFSSSSLCRRFGERILHAGDM